MKSTTSAAPTWLLGLFLALSSLPSAAWAGPSGGDAVSSYKKGRMLIEQRKYAEALTELESSNAQMPSPNTLLLIAHANRELGRIERAAAQYEQVIADADAKVKAGEARFQMTLNDARTWLDKLSKELGWVTISVTNATSDVVLRVKDEIVTPSSSEGGVLKVEKIWVRPGTVTVTADRPGGASRTATADVPRGGPASVVIDLALGASKPSSDAPVVSTPASEDPAEDSGSSRVPMGTWIAGGVGVAGLAAFGVFGSMARSKANELDACSPRCPDSQRSTADDGKRDQTFANVGLVVGGLGLATAVGLYVWRPKSAPTESQVGVTVMPGGVNVAGTF